MENSAGFPKSVLICIVEDLAHAIHSEGVTLRLGEMATTKSLLALAPDAVIVTVGASNFMPPILGVDGSNVRDAWKILACEQNVLLAAALFNRSIFITENQYFS